VYWDGILKAQWPAMRGSVRRWWGKLSDEDVASVDGRAERLVDLLQRKYGYSAERAWAEIEAHVDPNATVPFATG
jgi:uncharacterized protein YjbJ (UPF0337 family)